MNIKQVNQYLELVRQVVDRTDTSAEVRQLSAYLFLTGVADRLAQLGMPDDLAAAAAARIYTNLPPTFAEDYPDQFAELIRLYSKQTFVLWKTCVADFSDDVYEDVFLSLVKTNRLDLV